MSNGNSMTMGYVRTAFQKAFCGGQNCDGYPCMINRLNDWNCDRTFREIIKSCPNYKDGMIEKVGNYYFTRPYPKAKKKKKKGE